MCAVGQLVFELYYEAAPKACDNFRFLCTGERVQALPAVGREQNYSVVLAALPGGLHAQAATPAALRSAMAMASKRSATLG